MVSVAVLQNVVLALALGALVGLERERVPGRKYAGVRTLSLLCGAGAVAVAVSSLAGSVLPVAIYLMLGAVFSLLVIFIRVRMEQEDLGLTTSATVFVISLVGVLTGYEQHFEAVATTLLAVFLLSEKKTVRKYTEHLAAKEIGDAVKLGILALVLYPVLPAGPVDPFNVLFLRKALLFVIFILLIQFAAYLGLNWWRNRLSLLAAAALGGVVSSLAVVTTMAQFVRNDGLEEPAYAAAIVAGAAMILRNGFLIVVLASGAAVLPVVAGPFLAAALVGAGFTFLYHRQSGVINDIDFATDSPFSFVEAFKFGVFFLAILTAAELSQTYLSLSGVYATAFLGGMGSSTAVVASAATLISSGSVNPQQGVVMVALSIVSSLGMKLVYTELGDARELTTHLVVPYLLMAGTVLAVAL